MPNFFDFDKELTFSMDATISQDLLELIVPKQPEDTKMKIVYKKNIQARKHRKKRINKKWLKKYGYKEVLVISDGWQFEDINGTYNFVKYQEE